jgi:acyl transferase domain-containing protein
VVIRKAYSNAGLGFEDTGYFESHGTGTPVGDPVEFSAIGNVFGHIRNSDNPLLIGSVKPSLGHGEAASAIPSLMKVVLSLENGLIPATIGIKTTNPKLNFHGGSLKIVQNLTPWPSNHTYRRASINSFGYGGANAHTVLDATDSYLGQILTKFDRLLKLEDYQVNDQELNGHKFNGHKPPSIAMNGNGNGHNGHTAISKSDRHYILPFSAHNEQTLQKNFEAVSEVSDKCSLSDLAYTLCTGRNSLSTRAYTLVSDSKKVTKGQLSSENLRIRTSSHQEPKIAFVFTGQGAQWPQMGMDLIKAYPSVRDTIAKMDEILAALPEPPEWTILDTLADPKSSSKINNANRSQTVCTAIQVAMVQLIRSWGINPVATVGHSSGKKKAQY